MPTSRIPGDSNKMSYQVAIPSKSRADIVVARTLKFLQREGVPEEFITVFVIDIEEEEYCNAIYEHYPAVNVKVGVPYLPAQRNFIQGYYEEGTHILFLDDDVESWDISHSLSFKELSLEQFIVKAFEYCNSVGSYIWSIYPVFNPFYRERNKEITHNSTYLIGAFYGIVNRKGFLHSTPDVNEKEDVRRSLDYFIHDKIVVRFNRIGFVTKYFGKKGGMGTLEQRLEEAEIQTGLIYEEYGSEYISMKVKKSGLYDVRFKRVNSMIPVPAIYSIKPPVPDKLKDVEADISDKEEEEDEVQYKDEEGVEWEWDEDGTIVSSETDTPALLSGINLMSFASPTFYGDSPTKSIYNFTAFSEALDTTESEDIYISKLNKYEELESAKLSLFLPPSVVADIMLDEEQPLKTRVIQFSRVPPTLFERLHGMLDCINLQKKKENHRRGFPPHECGVFGMTYPKFRKKGEPKMLQLAKASLEYPKLYAELQRVGKLLCPADFKFNAIHINKNTKCPEHLDDRNGGKSVLVSFGEYEGSMISTRVGEEKKVFNTKCQPVLFDGRYVWHGNTERIDDLQGDKYSLVYYWKD